MFTSCKLETFDRANKKNHCQNFSRYISVQNIKFLSSQDDNSNNNGITIYGSISDTKLKSR